MKTIQKELKMPELYEYIGSKSILSRVKAEYTGKIIKAKVDIDNWIQESQQKIPKSKILIATYVINKNGDLMIADRHSEHVQCAFKEAVLSAGEIGFEIKNNKVSSISFVSNQSTGYCPSPQSWKHVEKSLTDIEGLNAPASFNPAFEFSYCLNCETLKIIKEDWYFCYKCGDELFTDDEFQRSRKHLDL